MMRISDSCRRRADRAGTWGFSLLELLVVLAIVSIMVALVAPRLAGTVQAITTSGDRVEIARQIGQLPLLARANGRPIRIGPDLEVQVEGIKFPEGWTVSTVSALRVAANGLCSPAQLRVDDGTLSETWSVAAPDCTVNHAP